MINKYYLLATGRIVREYDMRTAFSICTGFFSENNVDMYNRWKNNLYGLSISNVFVPTDELVKMCVKSNQMVMANAVYRDIYNCSLSEARDKVQEISDSL